MTTSPVLRFPRTPVDPGGLHPAGDERITRRQELPPIGHGEFTQVRVQPACLGVVDVKILRRRVIVSNHPPIVARVGAGAQRRTNADEAVAAQRVLERP